MLNFILLNYLNNDMDILSIGSGIGGLEVLINANLKDQILLLLKKTIYRKRLNMVDNNNFEAYNNIKFRKIFNPKWCGQCRF